MHHWMFSHLGLDSLRCWEHWVPCPLEPTVPLDGARCLPLEKPGSPGALSPYLFFSPLRAQHELYLDSCPDSCLRRSSRVRLRVHTLPYKCLSPWLMSLMALYTLEEKLLEAMVIHSWP